MAVALTKINSFVENLAKKLIDLSGAGLKIALTNTAHTATWDELADLTPISYTNLSGATPLALSVAACAQTAGTLKLTITDLVLTATGAVGPFRYIYIYDDASTGDKLIAYYDIGSEITLQNGDTYTINFDGDAGVLTIA